MGIFGSFGKNERPLSTGEEVQCDCPVTRCGCDKYGVWVPEGQPIPDTIVCSDCGSGKHVWAW